MITYPLNVESISDKVDPTIVGNKAYNLMVMSTLGMPIPKGFVIPSSVDLTKFNKDDLAKEASLYNLKFPVSVRSSGAISMPGMMDTILNVGAQQPSERDDEIAFKLECHLRLVQSLGSCVFEIDDTHFSAIEKAAKDFYIDDPVSMNRKIIDRFYDIWIDNLGFDFYQEIDEQLYISALAVKQSWYSTRAYEYREAEGISHDGGTSVIVQEMVFGNRNDTSGTGVVFSHNPNTGKPELYGDFLPSSQGEDIVSGTKIPRSIESMLYDDRFKKCGKQLKSNIGKLLRHFKFMQDVEFTIENGELFILQTRNGKCSPKAAIRSALSMVNNGSISIAEATDMVMQSLPSNNDTQITVDQSAFARLGFGIGVAEGEAIGYIACSKDYAEQMKQEGKPYVFCSLNTSPEDTESMRHSVGVVTSMGGRLSHAAILARSMGKPTVVGFEPMIVSPDGFIIDDEYYMNGEMIKIDGTTGAIFHAPSS